MPWIPPPTPLPPGPWSTEPDRVEWRTAVGLPALIVRTPSGHLCGYVAVPPGHPMHGCDDMSEPIGDLRVHGGITYGAACNERVCHVPAPGEPDNVWWLGFDAAHAGDIIPRDVLWVEKYRRQHPQYVPHDEYRTVDYMREQCELLALQIKAAAP